MIVPRMATRPTSASTMIRIIAITSAAPRALRWIEKEALRPAKAAVCAFMSLHPIAYRCGCGKRARDGRGVDARPLVGALQGQGHLHGIHGGPVAAGSRDGGRVAEARAALLVIEDLHVGDVAHHLLRGGRHVA